MDGHADLSYMNNATDDALGPPHEDPALSLLQIEDDGTDDADESEVQDEDDGMDGHADLSYMNNATDDALGPAHEDPDMLQDEDDGSGDADADDTEHEDPALSMLQIEDDGMDDAEGTGDAEDA